MTEEYYHTKSSVDEYIKMAEGYSGGEIITKLEKFLSPGNKVLELGSGPGTDWQILNENFNVVGSDNSKEFLKHLRTQTPSGEFIELDAATLVTSKSFDAIYSNKVLHHLTDQQFESSIKRQFEILNPNGMICHSFWNGEGTEIYNGLFVNYHTEVGIRDVLNKKFEILHLELYKEFEDGDSILVIARKIGLR